MFERFTERARQIIVIAQELAREHTHTAIGADHLLVAASMEQEGLAGRILDDLNFNIVAAEAQLDEHSVPTNEPVQGQIPFTSEAKTALEQALRHALSIGHNYIGTETVLLGLTQPPMGPLPHPEMPEPDKNPNLSPAVKILRRQGITESTIKARVMAALSGKSVMEGPADDEPDDGTRPEPGPEPETPPTGDDLLGQIMGQLVSTSQQLQQVRAATPSYIAPNFGMTRQQLLDVGESALYSMTIIGVSPEFQAGYKALADAASHLLVLSDQAANR